MSDLAELLARVEAAEGPDRDLDGDLWWVLDHANALRCFNNAALGLPRELPATLPVPAGLGRASLTVMSPRVTASLDASLALCERVLPGWSWQVRSTLGHPEAWLTKHRPGEFSVNVPNAKTPALALLAAMLKAKIAEEAA